MRAIRVHQFGGPEVLKIEEVSTPHAGPGQVLVRVHAAGVNPVETYIRAGTYPALPPLPFIPGKDCAGIVEQVGDGVRQVKAGDRVYTSNSMSGVYAEYTLCHEEDVHLLPAKLSFAQGAGVNTPYATAYRALFQRAKGVPGETVLIHGASGGVGTAATQLARAAGMTVFGTAGSNRGKELVEQNGAHHVLDHHQPDYLDRAAELTGGRGFDVILEMLANINLGKDLPVLAKGGRVVVVGSRGKVEINPRDLMQRDAQILGMVFFNASAEERRNIYAALGAGFEVGTLNPIIGKEFPLAEAAAAHQAVMAPGAYGKIVLKV